MQTNIIETRGRRARRGTALKRVRVTSTLLLATALAGAALGLSACGGNDGESQNAQATIGQTATAQAAAMEESNIVETAAAAGDFKTLASLLGKAGLAGTLQGKGPFTVFAPTDAAFAKVPKATLAALARDKAALRSVLLYHVVQGEVTAADVAELKSAKTLNGQSVAIRVGDGNVHVGDARVTSADIAASNGVIHVIDTVLIPS
jgi:uncharacterized surface protein with fasciclin (FAS1) repeats